ncbi:hypothetical protein ISF_05938 [Cordyceps fumosorosea ARSEF 2679]|uniref:Uncharacterized protein n=1 Tax=Cordyceps fumosorosea (strain ARSEF 2679) TaxID=1081104 RepID=A0A167SU26_CORFA|nr:hypothetical protein ISF_05938 [Cordyceps fumosorosea ARSEF 2679]OAA59927.1 hypothetical protein ISF_05938 [Cordyceps fumosorosea ARSEF 2679]
MGQDEYLLVWAENHRVLTVQWTDDKKAFRGDEKLYECSEVLAVGSEPTFVIRIRFKDATSGLPSRYCLNIRAANIGNVWLNSNKFDSFAGRDHAV